jgi:hypothetical protein
MTALALAAFAGLLQRAVSEPGIISKAYSAFHGYSVGNQILRSSSVPNEESLPDRLRRSWAGGQREVRTKGREGNRAVHACDVQEEGR